MIAFITRALSDDSEFKKRLAHADWQVEGKSLVTLSPLPFSEIPAADWVFFSSKNAVRFFFQQLESNVPGDFKSPGEWSGGNVKWAALGPATARALAEYVGQVDFVGTGEPKGTAAAFQGVASAPAVILFPAARHSRQSVMSFLAPDFQCVHFPIYDNRPVAEPPHSDADVLVFTSPMNAQAYFSKNILGKKQRVAAIGATTAEALQELGISKIEIATEPTEQALAEAVLRLQW
jgi:uroporphyrinogen-III synthase